MTDSINYEVRLNALGRYRNGTIGYGLDKDGNKFTVSYRDYHISPYFGELKENGVVIDAEAINHNKDFTKWVMHDPSLDPSLDGLKYRQFTFYKPEVDPVIDLDQNPSLMDKISSLGQASPLLMADIWAKRGALIGIRTGAHIIFSDGVKVRIPEFKDRNTAPFF